MSDRSNEDLTGPDDSNPATEPSPEYRLPPTLTWRWTLVLWGLVRPLIVLPICFLGYICFQLLVSPTVNPACPCWVHLALILLLIGLVADRFLCHRSRVHKEQVADRSEVEAMIQEAKNVRPRLTFQQDDQQVQRPPDFSHLKEQLNAELKRLTNIGPEAWTNYQVLTLDRLLIEFLPIEDLKARAKSSLTDLAEYAEGGAFSYDARLYSDWDNTINKDIQDIDDCDDGKDKQDCIANKLRADLRSLLEHVANYESNWAQGKTIVHGIRICGSVAVLAFLFMGLLAAIYDPPNPISPFWSRFGILQWGFLGTAGALTSVLHGLRDSDDVEVGNTRGVQVLWRTVLGATLGFVAGILIFSILAGGLIEAGSAVPDLTDMKSKDVYLSIVWAVSAGMGFEAVFQRVRTVVAS